MNDEAESQISTQANEFGVAFTSSSPFVGYHYATQQPITSSSIDRVSASSIVARATAMEASTPMSRATSSSSHSSSRTAVACISDFESDAEVASTSSHALHAAYNRAAYSISSSSPFTAPPVTLLVGGPKSPSRETWPVTFYVHENVLTQISPFFRAGFELNSQAAFSEGVSRTMQLPEDRPEDFAYLLQWVYWQLSNTPPSTHTPEQYPALVSLQGSNTSALSLWHPSIDIPLSHFQAYRAMKEADKALAGVAKDLSEPPPLLSTIDANDWHFGLALQSNIQQSQVQPPASMQPTVSIETAKDDAQASTDSSAPDTTQKPKIVRPPPPAFGPLVRLYVLADKYALPTSLKRDICARVRDVGKQGKCVPDADDIATIWESVLEDAEGHYGRGDEQTNPKDTILEMYERLSTKSFRELFFAEGQDGAEEVYHWHPVFMRDLLARKFGGCNAATTVVASDGRKGVEGEDGGWESFGELGRARRRERFPSLYGVTNRSGEEVLGGAP